MSATTKRKPVLLKIDSQLSDGLNERVRRLATETESALSEIGLAIGQVKPPRITRSDVVEAGLRILIGQIDKAFPARDDS